MRISAYAKLNLFLHITGKRKHGYHALDSLMVPISLADELHYIASDKPLSLTVDAERTTSLENDTENNIVVKAARLMAKECGIEAKGQLHLKKYIPIAAGMGGGSADAAATLKLLQRAWSVSCSKQVLDAMALKLGADVPFCMQNKPSMVRGVGEVLEPIKGVPALWVVLVNPDIALSTQAVFKANKTVGTSPVQGRIDRWSNAEAFIEWLDLQCNDLTAAAVELVPQIQHVLDVLAADKYCMLSRMSGSGATCFGLYMHEQQARACAENLRNHYPQWWSCAAHIIT